MPRPRTRPDGIPTRAEMADDDDPLVIICAGPPLCSLQDDEAVAAQNAGCELCKRIIVHADGKETIVTRTIN